MSRHANHDAIVAAFAANPKPLIEWAADSLVALGAKSEWDMEDNFLTTEGLAGLASDYNLPPAGDQDDEALRFYGQAAVEIGYPADIEDEEED